MGFLIFAYRKLTLKRDINQKSFRQMQLSMEKQQLDSQINMMQQSTAAQQDMAQQVMGDMSNMLYASSQMSIFGANQGVAAAEQNYKDALKSANGDNNNDNVRKAQEQFEGAKTSADRTRFATMGMFQGEQQKLMMMNQQVNSVFAAQDKARLQALKTKENRIDTEMASLESQLKLENAEYDSVEKAESEEAKKGAPKFGLG